MAATKTAGTAGQVHIHVDAVNGKLQFTPESNQNPAHVSGSEPQVRVGVEKPGKTAVGVKVVATPAAAKLLAERGTQP
jgi:hypothetical protein